MGRPTVAVVRVDQAHYSDAPPYHPTVAYPEYPFKEHVSTGPNFAYAGVRDLLHHLELDPERWGSPAWNPLGSLIAPGMTVVLKPNFVLSRHPHGKDLYSIITHPSVLRAVADYCWIALKGSGRIVIADAPQYDCNFSELLASTRLDEVARFYDGAGGPEFQVLDLRNYWSRWKHFASLLIPLPGDPSGGLVVNLGRQSALYGWAHSKELYGAVYRRQETARHHSGERHEYEVSRTIMNADAVISIPKLKVHKKVGVTLNAKGLVGITTNKNFLVHYTLKPPAEGGDQYPDEWFTPMEERLIRTERWMYDHFLSSASRPWEYLHRSIYFLHNNVTRRCGLRVGPGKRLLDAGNWHGNDSAWRMVVDLLGVFHFADTDGRLQTRPQRRMLSVVDGIIGGEHNGPLAPDPKPAGCLIGGTNLLAVDVVGTRVMGFDPMKVRYLRAAMTGAAFDFGLSSLGEIDVIAATQRYRDCLRESRDPLLRFRPHPGWVGHLETTEQLEEAV